MLRELKSLLNIVEDSQTKGVFGLLEALDYMKMIAFYESMDPKTTKKEDLVKQFKLLYKALDQTQRHGGLKFTDVSFILNSLGVVEKFIHDFKEEEVVESK